METNRARQKPANALAAKAGRPHRGKLYYGYETDRVTIREDQAKVLQEIARRVIAGFSYPEIAWWLKERGIPTPTGNDWHAISIRAS